MAATVDEVLNLRAWHRLERLPAEQFDVLAARDAMLAAWPGWTVAGHDRRADRATEMLVLRRREPDGDPGGRWVLLVYRRAQAAPWGSYAPHGLTPWAMTDPYQRRRWLQDACEDAVSGPFLDLLEHYATDQFRHEPGTRLRRLLTGCRHGLDRGAVETLLALRGFRVDV